MEPMSPALAGVFLTTGKMREVLKFFQRYASNYLSGWVPHLFFFFFILNSLVGSTGDVPPNSSHSQWAPFILCAIQLTSIAQQSYTIVLVSQSCPTLCDPMNCNLPGSSVYGIRQVRILEIPFFGGSSQPKNRTWVSCTAGRFFNIWAARETVL